MNTSCQIRVVGRRERGGCLGWVRLEPNALAFAFGIRRNGHHVQRRVRAPCRELPRHLSPARLAPVSAPRSRRPACEARAASRAERRGGGREEEGTLVSCMASSRVGAMTTACTPASLRFFLSSPRIDCHHARHSRHLHLPQHRRGATAASVCTGWLRRFCNVRIISWAGRARTCSSTVKRGMRKASVLPDPVYACPEVKSHARWEAAGVARHAAMMYQRAVSWHEKVCGLGGVSLPGPARRVHRGSLPRSPPPAHKTSSVTW